jgi:hypothetical protein
MRRLTLLVVLVAFVFSCGGQWPLLQVVAWGNMIREYSRMVPLSQAVEMTFSGKYPCALCRAVFKHEKQMFFPAVAALARPPEVSPRAFFVRSSPFSTRSEAPPTPPPRFA